MIEKVWSRIVCCEGDVFTQIKGKTFSYKVEYNSIVPSTTNVSIAKSQFEKALEFVPLVNTTPIQHLWAPSYIYAILMDEKISRGDW